MRVFKILGQNIYDPIYFRVVRSETTGAAIKYYYKLVVILAFVITIFFSLALVPALLIFSKLVENQGSSWYPSDLTLTIKEGKVSTNVAEPYQVPFPVEWRNKAELAKDPLAKDWENLIVIDTKNDFNFDRFKDYRAPVWLNADSLIYQDQSGVVIKPLPREVSLIIDQKKIDSWMAKLSPILTALIPISVVGLFLLLLVTFSIYLLVLLVVALLVILIGHLKQIKLSYGEAYRLTIHAATLPLILSAVSWFLLPFINFHFLPTIILLFIVTLNLKDEEELVVTPI